MGLFRVNPIVKRKWEEHKASSRSRHEIAAARRESYTQALKEGAEKYGQERAAMEYKRRLARDKRGRGLSSLNWGAAGKHMSTLFDIGGPSGGRRGQPSGGMMYDPIQGWVSGGRRASAPGHRKHRRKSSASRGKTITIRV